MPALNPIQEARNEWLSGGVYASSKMAQLSPEDFERVVGWHWNNRLPFERVLEMAKKENIAVPKLSAFSEFCSSFLPILRRAITRSASRTAQEIANSEKVPFVEAIRRQLSAEIFGMMQDPTRDTKELCALIDRLSSFETGDRDSKQLALKVKTLEHKVTTDATKLEQAERKLAILEAKATKATDTLGNAELTNEQKIQRMRETFGIA